MSRTYRRRNAHQRFKNHFITNDNWSTRCVKKDIFLTGKERKKAEAKFHSENFWCWPPKKFDYSNKFHRRRTRKKVRQDTKRKLKHGIDFDCWDDISFNRITRDWYDNLL